MQTNMIVRADASTRIGTGHIMRCIALAHAWQEQGGDVTFLSHCDSKALRQRIIDEGFEFIPIEKPCPDPNDLSFTLDMLSAISYQPSAASPWLALDGYHFTTDYQKAIKDQGYRLLVIDDMAHLAHYHADILLNQNIHASSLHYSCDRDTVKLLGCEYVLLRREFLKYKDWKREIPEMAKKILVTMGGADPDNVTLKVIRALNNLGDQDLEVKVVAGSANPNIDTLKKEFHLSPFTFHLLPGVSNMPELMAWADMAVSGGGSTCWELAFMGVPFAVIVLAVNQEGNAEGVAEAGAAINCGSSRTLSIEGLAERLAVLIESRSKRMELRDIGRQLVDGKGADRVVERMSPTSLCLRNARQDDCELIFQWANDPVARTASFHSDPIPWDEHKRWFSSKIQDPNCVFFIATTHVGEAIAQVRFEMKDGVAVISASLRRELRECGWGSKIIRQACEKLFRKRKVECVQALIKNDNVASLKSFKKAGFEKAQDIERQGFPATLMRYGRRNDA